MAGRKKKGRRQTIEDRHKQGQQEYERIRSENEAEDAEDTSCNDDPEVNEARSLSEHGVPLFPAIPSEVSRGIGQEPQLEAPDDPNFRPDHYYGCAGYWTPERRAAAANEVAVRLIRGESLRRILGPGRDKARLPSMDRYLRWMFGQGDEYVVQTYRLARQMQAEVMSDELVEISDRPVGGDMAEVKANALAIETRQWVLAKMLPKVYGVGKEAGAGLTINISTNLGGKDEAIEDGTYRVVAPDEDK